MAAARWTEVPAAFRRAEHGQSPAVVTRWPSDSAAVAMAPDSEEVGSERGQSPFRWMATVASSLAMVVTLGVGSLGTGTRRRRHKGKTETPAPGKAVPLVKPD
jgi:hypothetical protein